MNSVQDSAQTENKLSQQELEAVAVVEKFLKDGVDENMIERLYGTTILNVARLSVQERKSA